MNVSRQEHEFHRLYTQCGDVLEHHKDNAYLGVLISSDLTFTNHINSITACANSTLGLIKRNLKCCRTKLEEIAYISLMCSKIEYPAAIWDPHLWKDVNKLGRCNDMVPDLCAVITIIGPVSATC